MALYKALASSALSAAVGLPVAVTFLDTVGYIAQVMGVSMQVGNKKNLGNAKTIVLICVRTEKEIFYSKQRQPLN